MRFAFAIFKYFPYGGLQLDMMRTARTAIRNGHSVVVFTMSWEGERFPGLEVHLIAPRGFSNHARALHFSQDFQALLPKEKFDRTFAWNRIPGCDFYFCADNCLLSESLKKHSLFALKFLPRYRIFLGMERAIFEPDSKTVCLYLTERQKTDYQHYYQTQDARLILLPPGINDKVRSTPDDAEIRSGLRKKLGLTDDSIMLLQAGFNAEGKGGDRSIRAVAALPAELRSRTRLYLAGGADPKPCAAIAEKLGIASQVFFPGPQQNIADWMKAADLLIHPARNEATGTVLLEALACKTPVLCSGECGFANFVRASGCYSTTVPTAQSELNDLLLRSLNERSILREKAAAFAENFDFYGRADAIIKNLTGKYPQR